MGLRVREACSCGAQVEGPAKFVLNWRSSHLHGAVQHGSRSEFPVGFVAESHSDTDILGE